MNPWLMSAAFCTLLIGAVHSAMGERRIFRHLREGRVIPTRSEPHLRAYQLAIVWASWHLVTVFGLGVTAMLFAAALPDMPPPLRAGLTACAVGIMLLAAALVAFATRGRHLAWLALSLTSALALAGMA